MATDAASSLGLRERQAGHHPVEYLFRNVNVAGSLCDRGSPEFGVISTVSESAKSPAML